MANETQYSNMITLAAAVDAAIVPMFTSQVIAPRLVAPFNVGAPNTRVKDLPKSGSITASVVAEIGAATSQTLTDTKVTLTLQKAVVLLRPSIESVRFAAGADPNRLASLSAQACAKKFDQDVLALAAGFSQVVDAGATMTVAKILEAAYLVRAGNIPSQRLVGVLNYKQSYEIGNDIRNSSGSFYANPQFNPERALNGAQAVPGFLGTMLGIELYESGNTALADSNTNHVGGVWAPQFAIAALYPSGDEPAFETSIAEQTEFANSILNIKTMMWYQVGEYVDSAGVCLKSDVA
jgi:hypothetical protein